MNGQPQHTHRFVNTPIRVNNEIKQLHYVGINSITVRENNRLKSYPRSSVHPADLAIALGTNLGTL